MLLAGPAASAAGRLGVGRFLEACDDAGRDPAAVTDLDSLAPGPGAHLGGVRCAGSRPTAAYTPPGRATDPAACLNVFLQRIAKRLCVSGVQVDLVIGTVHSEADRCFGSTSVEVVDEESLYALSHECSVRGGR